MNLTHARIIILLFFCTLTISCATKSTNSIPDKISATETPVKSKLIPTSTDPELAKTKVIPEPEIKIITPANIPEPVTQQISETENTPTSSHPPKQNTVLFAFDSIELNEKSKNIIDAHIQYLKNNPMLEITLEGHADAQGDSIYNKDLSNLRANAIKDKLISQGVEGNQINIISYGDEKPVMKGNTLNAWRSNRRAVFVYRKIGEQNISGHDLIEVNDVKMFVSDQ